MANNAEDQDQFAVQRREMLADIEAITLETRLETGRSVLSKRVMSAMAKVPRHLFVPPGSQLGAYDDRPLPIGHGQTISQPFIVALMVDLLDLKPGDRVLEVGTGCGYQAAILAELARDIYSVEIVVPLAQEATERLKNLGYERVNVRSGDGYLGWPDQAPFDAIIVAAAALDTPEPLIDQLRPGGKLLIPVGPQWSGQELRIVEKSMDGNTSERKILAVRFVPLTRDQR
jgi:protein-L-isoaspartate(D-aspartate) O-methyltransferase